MFNRNEFMEYVNFNPRGYVKEKAHILGEGSLGGKAKGLLFAKYILENLEEIPPWPVYIPPSRFISTEVFDDFIKINSLEEVVEKGDWDEVKKAFDKALLPDSVIADLQKWVYEMDYPLAVRSSSLLEDNIKYSFAGKYLTLFISNRGSVEERIKGLVCAIKKVYASTYSPSAQEYRKKRSLTDEKMGVIIQQLIGRTRGVEFYPEIAGVGFSRNYRRWTERIRIEDGVVRIVFGLGTRCTGRNYARIFSLSNLALRPEGSNPYEIMRYSQENFDLLDLGTGEFKTYNINDRKDLIKYHPHFDKLASLFSFESGMVIPFSAVNDGKIIFTFDGFPKTYPNFFRLIGFLFRLFEKKMGMPVDVEFASEPRESFFALVQLRPLLSYESYRPVAIPKGIPEHKIILRGNKMLTNGMLRGVRYLVYVDPWKYMEIFNPYSVAREIGRINRSLEGERFILIGPGRWGSTNPRQGVPIEYSEISNCGIIVEIGILEKGFTPELSYGTHFFADLDIDGILYLPVFIGADGNLFNKNWFDSKEYEMTKHPAIRIYRGSFSVYLDGNRVIGVVIDES
ncbi:MAG: PEP/pyruvate-binding domain-containing protein [Synergistetes bacterium]|nr:PEP/pyruvate-binding domain-containing protein [Synergistota bacterium]MCX8127828.1 PEP/pyruvate-binding domain-containing protein [Synergistota bacterium]MDW8192090.1 PEP/pyruvate-binding domain-containing protein [Synergistota bacterium]